MDKGVDNSVRMRTLALILGVTVAMSGCAVMGGGDESTQLTAAQLTSQADAKLSDGQDDAAVALLRKVTLKNPVDPAPWLKIAKIRFEADDYVDALVASEEVISRDRTNETGNSIALVSSLRLAERSISLLRSGTDLKGSMRERAQQLAAQLRETLGEDVLLPAGAESHNDSQASQAHSSTQRTTHRSSPDTSHETNTTTTTHSTSDKAPDTASAVSESSASGNAQQSGSKADSQAPAQQESNGNNGSMNPFETLQKLPQ